jgi:hypothetical protein
LIREAKNKHSLDTKVQLIRRTVKLYEPRNASDRLFKEQLQHILK